MPLHHFAGLVLANDPLPSYVSGPSSAKITQIAARIVGLLAEGETLQLGFGNVQMAVLQALTNSGLYGLKLHAGMISSVILEPMQLGVFSRGVALGDVAFYGT